jgi:hypothetical protein
MKNAVKFMVLGAANLFILGHLTGCGSGKSSYSILPTGQSFTQSNSSFNNQLDILWVVDNSGSMAPIQANMTTNFQNFISNFETKGYDYRMAVTSTDAYKANKSFTQYSAANSGLSLFLDGAPGSAQSGTFIIIPTTPNLDATFVTNATTGINGSGDERAFSSMMTTMANTANPAFLRTSSFFAVIIISDEDDFSSYGRAEQSWGNNSALDHCYVNKAMDTIATTAYSGANHVSTCVGQTPPDTVASYESALDTLTQTTGTTRRWNVSTISVLDSACQLAHSQANSESSVSIQGQRYVQISQDSQGIQGSLCDTSYATSLTSIASQIATLSTQFFLTKIPQVSTIVVTVNGKAIVQDPANGWTYNSTTNSIQFHGTAVPAQGAAINVNFVPTTITT